MAPKLKTQQRALYQGDNLEILREKIESESVDLIYLDPPFNSNAKYSTAKNGRVGNTPVEAFSDVWRWNENAISAYDALLYSDNKELTGLIELLHNSLISQGARGKEMMAYLVMMAIRLIELERVLNDGGLIYLHCDPTASHYLKLILDSIFGLQNYRNEIIWGYNGGGIPKYDFPRKHDIIFRYSKGEPRVYKPVYKMYTSGTQQRGRTAVKGPHAQLRASGTPMGDWWFSNLECGHCGEKLPENIKRIASPTDKENLSYPTQKSEELLARIVESSSNEGDLILDPFCGSGTTLAVAEELNRDWIGIDVSEIAIDLTSKRLSV